MNAKSVLRYGLFPIVFLGGNAAGILMVVTATPLWLRLLVLLGIVAVMLAAERLLPFQTSWNRDLGDTWRDVAHAAVNTTLNYAGIWLLPALASFNLFASLWPHHWPFVWQVVFAVLVLDVGITLMHFASHRIAVLWRFHAVHHSVQRLYSFNGLMKHPVHQSIETAGGILPLLLLGIPVEVASTVVFAVALQLLLQHSNADYRTGPCKFVFAIAEIHRLHHRRNALGGDVNFGLFTNFTDHLLGTFAHDAGPLDSSQLGVRGRPDYPRSYVAQLCEPFRRRKAEQRSAP